MKAALETAIKALAEKAKNANEPHVAMHYAQAALNLANADATMEATRRENAKPQQ